MSEEATKYHEEEAIGRTHDFRVAKRLLRYLKPYWRLVAGALTLTLLANGGIDLVLSDQMMPGMTGTELTKAIKARSLATPVILISGVNEIPADANSADRFISKAGGPELLFKTVSEVLAAYRHTR